MGRLPLHPPGLSLVGSRAELLSDGMVALTGDPLDATRGGSADVEQERVKHELCSEKDGKGGEHETAGRSGYSSACVRGPLACSEEHTRGHKDRAGGEQDGDG